MTQTKKASYISVFSLVVLFSSILLSNTAHSDAFISKAQYEDYSVRYQCAELRYHDDLAKKEDIVLKLEEDFGITEETFDEFDELIPVYEKDDNLLNNVRTRVQKECT
tara:strand:+ start:121267 stop:121590 length:324 start_codon:yes stop_codon:yes gene_type:complete